MVPIQHSNKKVGNQKVLGFNNVTPQDHVFCSFSASNKKKKWRLSQSDRQPAAGGCRVGVTLLIPPRRFLLTARGLTGYWRSRSSSHSTSTTVLLLHFVYLIPHILTSNESQIQHALTHLITISI